MTSFPSSRFPWENAMTIGMGPLRLPPETFWRMTREELAELVAMFPDC
ncbi:phage tail assembly chaperone [Parvibaculum sp.]|nr:phage tail assembly chaperone [Parvibaculum sp.]